MEREEIFNALQKLKRENPVDLPDLSDERTRQLLRPVNARDEALASIVYSEVVTPVPAPLPGDYQSLPPFQKELRSLTYSTLSAFSAIYSQLSGSAKSISDVRTHVVNFVDQGQNWESLKNYEVSFFQNLADQYDDALQVGRRVRGMNRADYLKHVRSSMDFAAGCHDILYALSAAFDMNLILMQYASSQPITAVPLNLHRVNANNRYIILMFNNDQNVFDWVERPVPYGQGIPTRVFTETTAPAQIWQVYTDASKQVYGVDLPPVHPFGTRA
jgi:hypothetical protein